MNKRIRELMLESDCINLNISNKMEKFAELIIRECADLVKKHNYQTIQNEEPLYGITSPEILEHFGVKE